MSTTSADNENYGLGLKPGDAHYRAYVGHPERYDYMAGLQFSLLHALGLRETHRVLEVGCGSLRVGRLLITYLRRGNYFGIEPNRWLVEEAVRRELGSDLVDLKRPAFLFRSDFAAETWGVEFDYVLAHSIFSHTYADLARTGLARIARVIGPRGKVVVTFKEGRSTAQSGSGWLYPGIVSFSLTEIQDLMRSCGLVVRQLRWLHPGQTWFLTSRPEAEGEIQSLADRIQPPVAA